LVRVGPCLSLALERPDQLTRTLNAKFCAE
jgi:hypothetical protein